jgi:putative SOS response-associated peptidase YedK
VVSKTSAELSSELSAENDFQGSLPSYNVAPTQVIPVLMKQGSRRLIGANWGIIPAWSTSAPKSPLINARVETILDKPSFKSAVSNNRCVVPASGYFEWMTEGAAKTPFFIHSERLLLFAAVFEKPNSLSERHTVSIITKDSAKQIEHIHDRNPIMLEDPSAWLNPEEDPKQLLSDISDQSDRIAKSLRFHEVNKAVGSVKNNRPDLINPESDQKLFD